MERLFTYPFPLSSFVLNFMNNTSLTFSAVTQWHSNCHKKALHFIYINKMTDAHISLPSSRLIIAVDAFLYHYGTVTPLVWHKSVDWRLTLCPMTGMYGQLWMFLSCCIVCCTQGKISIRMQTGVNTLRTAIPIWLHDSYRYIFAATVNLLIVHRCVSFVVPYFYRVYLQLTSCM